MVVDARWIRVTLFCPSTAPIPFEVLTNHTTQFLGKSPHKPLTWDVEGAESSGTLEIETRHEERFSAYVLHFRTQEQNAVQGPLWLRRLTMALFEPTGASLGFATAVEPGLEYQLGLHLGVLMAPWSIAVFVNRDYWQRIEAIRTFNVQAPNWMTETFGNGARGLFWPGWFGAPVTPGPCSWPWDVDIDLPYNHREDQISAVGFGPVPELEALADVLERWLDANPSLKLDPEPVGLPLDAWLLLAVSSSLFAEDLRGPELLVGKEGLRFSLNDFLATRRLTLLASLSGRSSCGHVYFTYEGHSLTLVFNAEPQEGACILELHFTLGHEDDAQNQGSPWQWKLLLSLVELAPLDWWSGDIYGNASSLRVEEINEPDVINLHPFVMQRTPTGIKTRVDDGWFEP